MITVMGDWIISSNHPRCYTMGRHVEIDLTADIKMVHSSKFFPSTASNVC